MTPASPSFALKDLISPSWQVPDSALGLEVRGLCLDSRHVKPGDVFAAMPGVKVDGRDFIAKAEAAGAVAISSLARKKAIACSAGGKAIRSKAARETI